MPSTIGSLRLCRLSNAAVAAVTAAAASFLPFQVGTFAIAYAAHKALSPVRFPPTVALTPVVARWTGKVKPQEGAADSSSSSNGNGKQ
jgi:hypothetical protein